MLSTKPVLPNFLKTALFTAAAAMSVSAFAGNSGEIEVVDLKDINAEETTALKGDAKDESKESSDATLADELQAPQE